MTYSTTAGLSGFRSPGEQSLHDFQDSGGWARARGVGTVGRDRCSAAHGLTSLSPFLVLRIGVPSVSADRGQVTFFPF